MRKRENMRGKKDRHEAFPKDELQHENKTGWSPALSNVTQAAVHKERWREQITHEKKKLFYLSFQGFSRPHSNELIFVSTVLRIILVTFKKKFPIKITFLYY